MTVEYGYMRVFIMTIAIQQSVNFIDYLSKLYIGHLMVNR